MAQVEETFGVNAAMKLQKLMEGLPCKNLFVVNHPEVSPPVHITGWWGRPIKSSLVVVTS